MSKHPRDSNPSHEQDCAEFADAIALLPLGELTTEEAAAVGAHAATCAHCSDALAEYDMLATALRAGSASPSISRPLFSVDDIVLSAELSDNDEDSDGAVQMIAPVSAPHVQPIGISRRHRFARGFAALGAVAAVLLLALLAAGLFHIRGAPNSKVIALKGGGTLTEYTLPANGKLPGYIVAGPDGNVWFTETGTIVRITHDGKTTEFPLPANATNPSGLVLGPGNSLLLFADNEILRVSMAGRVTRVPLPASVTRPIGSVAAASDGTIWFGVPDTSVPGTSNAPDGANVGPVIGRISPQGDVTIFDTSKHISGNNVGVIAPIPDGSVWIYTELNLGRISPNGTITVVDPTPLNGKLVTSGTTDAAGNLWIIGGWYEGIGGKVVRYTPDGSWKVWSFSTLLTDASGGSIMTVRGRDGNLWTGGNGTLLRTTPDGAVKAYELPGNLIIGSLTVDADNNFWVTETGAYTISRIHLGGS